MVLMAYGGAAKITPRICRALIWRLIDALGSSKEAADLIKNQIATDSVATPAERKVIISYGEGASYTQVSL